MSDNQVPQAPNGMPESVWTEFTPEAQQEILEAVATTTATTVRRFTPRRVTPDDRNVDLAAEHILHSPDGPWSVTDLCDDLGMHLNDEQEELLAFITRLAGRDGITLSAGCRNCGQPLFAKDAEAVAE